MNREELREMIREVINEVKTLATLEDIAYSLLADAKRVKTPRGFGGFQVGWSEKQSTIALMFDTPREIRHPDEYGYDSDYGEEPRGAGDWNTLHKELQKIIIKYGAKYRNVSIHMSGGWSGAGIIVSGQVRPSRM